MTNLPDVARIVVDVGDWVAVWQSSENLGGTIGTDLDVLVARSTDNGASWTPPTILNTNAATDSGHDYWPQVTTDGGGNWVAVWHSGDSLAGSIGTDYDILMARSPNTPTGGNIVVPLNGGLDVIGGLEVTFPTVSVAGNTTVTISTTGPPPDTGYRIVGIAGQPTYYDINTTATFSTPVKVCIKYDEAQVRRPESMLNLMHDVDGVWEDITKPPPPPNPDVENDVICGETDALSVFAIMEASPPVGGIAEYPGIARTSGSGEHNYGVAATVVAASLVVVTASAWYARRRWGR